MKKQIFVVEGKNDERRLKEIYPNINVVSVNGSAINKDIVNLLIDKQDEYEIVLFMDPDYAGEKIRNEIENKLKHVTHIFIERDSSHNKNYTKIGVEHVSDNDLIEAMSRHMKPIDNFKSDISLSFLYQVGLVGIINSNNLRKELSKELNLGNVNGKTLKNRLNNFGICKEKVEEALKKVKAN